MACGPGNPAQRPGGFLPQTAPGTAPASLSAPAPQGSPGLPKGVGSPHSPPHPSGFAVRGANGR